MKDYTHVYPLTEAGIDKASEFIKKILFLIKIPSRETAKLKLKIEETLIFYMKNSGEAKEFTVKFRPGLNKKIIISVPGNELKPYTEADDEYLRNMMKTIGFYDLWQYISGKNTVTFSVPKKPLSQILQIIIAAALAATTGIIVPFLPEGVSDIIIKNIVSPVSGLISDILRCVACILIFASVSYGIMNIENIQFLKKYGKRLLISIFSLMFICITLATVFYAPALSFSNEKSAHAVMLLGIVSFITDIIPTNPISPFIDGNALQAVFMAIVVGIICAVAPKKTKIFSDLVGEISYISSRAMSCICNFIPLFIYLVIIEIILSGNLSVITSSGGIFLMVLLSVSVVAIINFAVIFIFGKMKPSEYLKKAYKPLLISLLTASSMASYKENIEVCKNSFGINENITDVFFPILQTLHMPGIGAMLAAASIGIAIYSDMKVSFTWVIMVIITAVLLSIASPPIPGSVAISSMLMVSQLGLPTEYTGLFVALGVVIDFVTTPVNIQGAHAVLLICDKR